ncbi:hemerythrin [Marinobacterium nitratireducens]|uniref:Hemerythrin n=1 Tax=Marinobacterium nitratireducens TaxID=518897 RepID=A0A917ZDG3_9GAMM|nr:hemerythrin domain-containing protein [Marinobacterium nitratireducens]GGO81036.1 hemerythrin [Marinobacterium nitratireducens]
MAILAELHKDHINLTRLLDILRAKVGKLRAGTRPNFRLLADAVDYVSDYADRHHHPIEDQMFAFFKERDPGLDALMEKCSAQHRRLHAASHELSDAIDSILNDTPMPMNEFIDRLEAYIGEQKGHLDFEEAEVFPALERAAQPGDWEELDEQLPKNEDPLFGENRSEEYLDLYRELVRDMKA